ncbi:MAG: DUF4198 domain-containing protein, partial [Rhodomicrobium sp.]
MKTAPFALAIALLASVTCAKAHDIWITIERTGGECRAVVNYGHPHDRPPALADKIVEFAAFTGQERLPLTEGLTHVQSSKAIVVVSRGFNDQGHSLVAVNYENGFWVKTPSGHYRNATRRSVPDALDSIWSVKFAKAVTGPGAPWGTVMGTELEIVPLGDPAAAKSGDSLAVRVLFEGSPLAGIAVERADGLTPIKEEDIPRFTTDKDGAATIPIAGAGPQVLAVDYKVV